MEEPPKPAKVVEEPQVVKHDVHYSTMHPQRASPEVEPDHELSCPIKHGRALMQQPKPWEAWWRGTEEWYTYLKAAPKARSRLPQPPPRDPSQFPVRSFFEVDTRTGRNRYGLKPTCVAAKTSLSRAILADPIKFVWKFPKEVDMPLWNAWKRYIYNFITMAFGWFVNGDDNQKIGRDKMLGFFVNDSNKPLGGKGGFNFTKEVEKGQTKEVPETQGAQSLYYALSRDKGNLRVEWNQYDVRVSDKKQGRRTIFTHENFRAYLRSTYGPIYEKMLGERPPPMKIRNIQNLMKAYAIMVIMGDCRAKVLSREVGEYDTGYVAFSERRRDLPGRRDKYGGVAKRSAHEMGTGGQHRFGTLARGKGLTKLCDFQESWQQEGQTIRDLDAEAREYYNAYRAGHLKDPLRNRNPLFDRFSAANAPRAVPADVPQAGGTSARPISLSTSSESVHAIDEPVRTLPPPARTIPPPAPVEDFDDLTGSPPVIADPKAEAEAIQAMMGPPPPRLSRFFSHPDMELTAADIPPPVEIVSNDPAPEARVNPRANTEPPEFMWNRVRPV